MTKGSPGKQNRLVGKIKRDRSEKAEKHREENELGRMLAEQQRELISLKQQTAAEDHRLAEQDRTISEEKREIAENGRAQSELERQDAEELRRKGEDLRVIRERNRQHAELLRQTVFEVYQETQALIAKHSILQQTVLEQMEILKMKKSQTYKREG